MNDDTAPGRTLKTVETAIEIADYIQKCSGADIDEISEEFNIAPSTVHGYVKTLESKGYLTEKNNEFDIGLEFLAKGGYTRTRPSEYDFIIGKVDDLAKRTGERAQFIVEEHGRGYYIHTSTGEQAVQVDAHIGKKIHLHASSAGKAILANLPKRKVEDIIGKWGSPAYTENTITDEQKLFQELDTIQDQGYATSDQESITGLRAVGVPIQPSDSGNLIGAISLSAPIQRLKDGWPNAEIADQVQSTVNEIELEVKYR